MLIDAPAAPSAAPAAPVVPVTPATPATPAAATSIADAGAVFRAAATWEDVNLAPPVVPTGDDAPAGTPAATPAESVPAGDEGPEFVQNAQGQWHRPDGTFANAEEIAAIDAQVAADVAAEAAAAPPKETPTVTLRRRDGTTRDVEVDDPELAEEIRTNYNDGMRKKDYTEKVALVETRLAEFNQMDAMLDKNPELFVFNSLTPPQQINLATALLAQHFDALVPIILGYDADPSKRITAVGETQRTIRDQEKEFQTFTTAQRAASAVRATVETLIPDTISPEVAEQFWADAGADLQRAIARGERVDPSTVPALLKARMTLYGFEAPAGSVPAAAPKPRITAVPALAPNANGSASPVATPVGDAAQALADAKAQQKRIKLTQRNRANAAAVPPVGAGAAPVRLPAVPAGASIEEASRALKKMKSWTS